VAVPFLTVFRNHAGVVALGTMMALANFVLFYILTVFCLSWGTGKLGYTREHFLLVQMAGIVFFALTIPCSALLADRHGRRIVQMLVSVGIGGFGLVLGTMFSGGPTSVLMTMVIGFALMGMTYGPLGTLLSELFPTSVRYTGSSLCFNLAGIFGASLAPYFATGLATRYGLPAVGYYITGSAVLTLLALWISRETRDAAYAAPTPGAQ
jgi:MFS family permease